MIQETNIVNWPKITLLEILREFFVQQTKYHFDAEERLSKVRIGDKNEIKFMVGNDDRPNIVVSRGQVRPISNFIADFNFADVSTGTFEFTDLFETTLTVNCLARNGLEAEEIASSIFGFVKFNREEFLKKGFLKIDQPIISDEQLLNAGSDFELFNVTIVFSVIYAIKWTREEIDPYRLHETEIVVRKINGV